MTPPASFTPTLYAAFNAPSLPVPPTCGSPPPPCAFVPDSLLPAGPSQTMGLKGQYYKAEQEGGSKFELFRGSTQGEALLGEAPPKRTMTMQVGLRSAQGACTAICRTYLASDHTRLCLANLTSLRGSFHLYPSQASPDHR